MDSTHGLDCRSLTNGKPGAEHRFEGPADVILTGDSNIREANMALGCALTSPTRWWACRYHGAAVSDPPHVIAGVERDGLQAVHVMRYAVHDHIRPPRTMRSPRRTWRRASRVGLPRAPLRGEGSMGCKLRLPQVRL